MALGRLLPTNPRWLGRKTSTSIETVRVGQKTRMSVERTGREPECVFRDQTGTKALRGGKYEKCDLAREPNSPLGSGSPGRGTP